MLRTTVLQPHLARPLLAASSLALRRNGAAFALRTFASSSKVHRPPILDKDLTPGKGSEGPHRQDATPITTPAKTNDDFPTLQGSWTLMQPTYTPEELNSVQVLHRDAKSASDHVAAFFARVARIGFDLVSGYKHKTIPPGSNMSLEELRKGGYTMDPSQWLLRIIFLETIAGVPGMVAASLRHLRSLRLMKRDAGWIHTLLEESENERMHLMTFMTLKKPSIFLRAVIMGAQGVFYNAFFLSYIISPKTCHRFVGKIEEEAVLTYTRCIEELENGHLPEWENRPAPSIAIDYWRLAPDAKLLDVIRAVRADEATHRFVNHTLGSLNQGKDLNPFALAEPNMTVKGSKVGFERWEAAEHVKQTGKLIEAGEAKQHAGQEDLEKAPLQ